MLAPRKCSQRTTGQRRNCRECQDRKTVSKNCYTAPREGYDFFKKLILKTKVWFLAFLWEKPKNSVRFMWVFLAFKPWIYSGFHPAPPAPQIIPLWLSQSLQLLQVGLLLSPLLNSVSKPVLKYASVFPKSTMYMSKSVHIRCAAAAKQSMSLRHTVGARYCRILSYHLFLTEWRCAIFTTCETWYP